MDNNVDPRKLFVDERLTGMCVYCGGSPSTRDHVPSKAFLDEPFPPNLPVVAACEACNNSFSADEQYLACLLECVLSGSTNPDSVSRNKVKQTMRENISLVSRIAASCRTDETGCPTWVAETDRVQKVVLKLARGHAAYEHSELQLVEPESVFFAPIAAMSEDQLRAFETLPTGSLLPEIGSRAFVKAVVVGNEVFTQEGDWQIVQKGRYRYALSHSHGIIVRMVLSEYLACEVAW